MSVRLYLAPIAKYVCTPDLDLMYIFTCYVTYVGCTYDNSFMTKPLKIQVVTLKLINIFLE